MKTFEVTEENVREIIAVVMMKVLISIIQKNKDYANPETMYDEIEKTILTKP